MCNIKSSASQALSFTPKVTISQNGVLVATVKKEVTFMSPKFTITLANNQILKLKGNWLAYKYNIVHPAMGQIVKIALALDWTDAYTVDVSAGQDVVLAIAYAICIDKLARD